MAIKASGPELSTGATKRHFIQTEIQHQQTGYTTEVEIGEPGQPMSLIIDTGSSTTWFSSQDTMFCQKKENTPCTYDPQLSTTFVPLESQTFQEHYLSGQMASGDLIQESITLSGTRIDNQTLGLAHKSSDVSGILGLGPSAATGTCRGSPSFCYPSILDSMYLQKHIRHRVFSVHLEGPDAVTGSILFGGVDHGKFEGQLKTIHNVAHKALIDSKPTSYAVEMTDVSVTGTHAVKEGSGTRVVQERVWSGSQPVHLDTGTTISYLPLPVMIEINQRLGAFTLDNASSTLHNFTVAPCHASNFDASFDFQFGGSHGPLIRVPLREMILHQLGTADVDGQQYCPVGFAINEDFPDIAILGGTFLRNAYTVYDLDNDRIAMAQARHGKTESKVQEGETPKPHSRPHQSVASVLVPTCFGMLLWSFLVYL